MSKQPHGGAGKSSNSSQASTPLAARQASGGARLSKAVSSHASAQAGPAPAPDKSNNNGQANAPHPACHAKDDILRNLFSDGKLKVKSDAVPDVPPPTKVDFGSLCEVDTSLDGHALVELALLFAHQPRDVISGRDILQDSTASISSQRKHERKDNATVVQHLMAKKKIEPRLVHQFCDNQADRKFIVPTLSSLQAVHESQSPKAEYHKRVFLAAHAVPWLLTKTFQAIHQDGSVYGPKGGRVIMPPGLELDYFAEIYDGQHLNEAALTGGTAPTETTTSGADAEIVAAFKEGLAVPRNSRESPETHSQSKTVAIFEFGTDPTTALYKLAQLEIRLAFWTAYQASKGRKCVPFRPPLQVESTDSPEALPPRLSATSATTGGGKETAGQKEVEVICGIVVPGVTHSHIHRVLQKKDALHPELFVFRNCRQYLCEVLVSAGTDVPRTVPNMPGTLDRVEYWVSIKLPDGRTELDDITVEVKNGEVSSNIAGLKNAVLKRLPERKTLFDLTVYPPGKTDDQTAIATPATALQSSSPDGPYRVEVM